MTNKDLHVGVIGVGRIGAFHARTLLQLDGVRAVTVSDAVQARAQSVAEQLGSPVAETPVALIAAGVDALVIATTTAEHASMLRLAADAGIPAFCEKPVALDLATMDSVSHYIAEAGILVQVGYQRRFDAGYRAARDAVSQGDVGTLLAVRAATHDPAPPAEEYIAVSGGIFRDLLIHDFDAIRFVTGREVISVYATGANRGADFFAAASDVDTTAAILTLDDGTLAVCTATRYNGAGYDVRLEACGSRGTLVAGLDEHAPLTSATSPVYAPGQPYPGFLERFAAAYTAELLAFVHVVKGEAEVVCTPADALQALLVAEAAALSLAGNRPVELTEVRG